MEIELDGQRYLCGKMPTRVQFHVIRRLLPCLQNFAPLIAQGATAPTTINLFDALAAFANSLPLLQDADVDYVLDATLDAVKFYSGGAWAPLKPAGARNGMLMLQQADDFATQVRLAYEVLAESLANFSFDKILPSSPDGPMATLIQAA